MGLVSATVSALVLTAGPAAAEPAEPLTGGPVPTAMAAALAYADCVPGGATSTDAAIANQVRGSMNGPRLGRNVNAYNISCARVITDTARGRGLDRRAAVIAVTTAITESTLHNYTEAADHDSLGLFQQRPSQGWGTPAQITDPGYSTNAFLNAMLRKFPNNSWMSGDIGGICQTVQVSAVPGAYSREVHDAQLIVDALWNGSGGVFHQVRRSAGGWSGFGGLGMPSTTRVASAAEPSGKVHVVAIAGGQLYHRVGDPSGSWSGWGQVGNPGGNATAVTAAADEGGNVHLAAIVGGQVWHRIAFVGGSWSRWGLVGNSGSATELAAAVDRTNSTLELVAVIGGQLWHRVRHTAGSWSGWGQVGNPGGNAAAVTAATDNGGNLHVAAIVGGQVWHRIGYVGGSWSGWGLIGNSGSATGLAAAIDQSSSALQVVAVIAGQIWHRLRASDGGWTRWGQVGNPGNAVTVATAIDPDGELHLVAAY